MFQKTGPAKEGPSVSVVTEYSNLLGTSMHLDVTRALSELRAQRPIRLFKPRGDFIAIPVEGLDDQRCREFCSLCTGAPKLIVTAQRARVMGIEASTTTALSIPPDTKARDVFVLATAPKIQPVTAEPADSAAAAAIRLIKLSRGVPAALAAQIADDGNEVLRSIVGVEISEVDRFFASAANAVTMTSDALVPLSSGATARFVVFRDALGADQWRSS